MSPRKRNKENIGLPSRWRFKHNAYYYQVPKGLESHWDGKQTFRLGKTLPESYREWANRIELTGSAADTMQTLCDRYASEHVSKLAPKSQESYLPSIKRIREVYGQMPVSAFEPHHARKYFDTVKNSKSLSVARSDLTVMRGMLAKAMDWGSIKAHPMTGMRFEQLAAAKDQVEDWEIDAMLSIEPNTRSILVGQLYTQLKLMMGCRRGDLLRIKLSDLKQDGIHITPNKTKDSSGVSQIFEWSEDENGHSELRSVTNQIKTVPPRRIGDAFLFTNNQGKGFVNEVTGRANGFDTLWQRYMDAVMDRTAVTTRIKEKTLRAYVSDASDSIEDAANRLGHTTTATTEKHYRKKPRRITPLPRKDSN